MINKDYIIYEELEELEKAEEQAEIEKEYYYYCLQKEEEGIIKHLFNEFYNK